LCDAPRLPAGPRASRTLGRAERQKGETMRLTGADAVGMLCAAGLFYLTWQLWLVTVHLRAAAAAWGLA
jgi:hypothetical protein